MFSHLDKAEIMDAEQRFIVGEINRANAARIVAAVNFCEGVSLEDMRYFADAAKRTQDLPPLEFMAETKKRLEAELAQKQKEIEGLRAELSATTSSAP